jgi:hypothetical protein
MPAANATVECGWDRTCTTPDSVEELMLRAAVKGCVTVIYLIGGVKDLSSDGRHEGMRMDLKAGIGLGQASMAARGDRSRLCPA